MVTAAGSSTAIALLCYMSAVVADQPSQINGHYMNHPHLRAPRQLQFSNSSGLPSSTSSSISFSSSDSIPPSTSPSISSISSSTVTSSVLSSLRSSTTSPTPPGNFTTSSSSFGSSTSLSSGLSSTSVISSIQSTTTSTTPVVITVNWSTVSASTTSSVASATHNSKGWPVIPIHNCWFCLPGRDDGGGIIIAGVTGPGTIPPPPSNVASSLGFSQNIPSITLDPEGNPSYPSTEPTSSPSRSPTTMSTITQSSSSGCTRTTTGYDYYVTCTASATDPLRLTSSTSCVTSTVTTTGCEITSTASTTTVAACPASVSRSVSSADDSQASSALTVVDGTTIPLVFFVDDTATPAGFTISYFGPIFTNNSTSISTPTSVSTSSASTSRGTSVPPTSSPPTSSSSASPTASPSASSSPSPSGSSTTAPSTSSTTAAPTPTATWYLTAYDVGCDSLDSSSDFSYYTLQGYSEQSPNEQCSNVQSGLPRNSDTSDSCEWFTNGGFDGPNDCSQGTFTKPKSFRIRSGFCTIFEDKGCQGGSNGVDSSSYGGCTNVGDAFVDFDWNSISCFAID